MEALLKKLRADFPQIHFVAGPAARWSSLQATIVYCTTEDDAAVWGLLHELGHADLKHKHYTNDAGLLGQEVAAWNRARELAGTYGFVISDDYIERCLDSYRDWLHRRSECPECGSHGLEVTQGEYSCPNCKRSWRVGSNRFCRTYRVVTTKNRYQRN